MFYVFDVIVSECTSESCDLIDFYAENSEDTDTGISFVYHSYHLPIAGSESINADSLNSNFLQLGRRRGGRPQRAVHPYAVTCQHCDRPTHYFSRPRTRNLPIVGPTRYQ